MRGTDDGNVIPAAVAVVIADSDKIVQDPDPHRQLINAIMVFDKPVPNGDATLIVDLKDGKRTGRLFLWHLDKDEDGKHIDLGRPTTRFNVQWNPVTSGFMPTDLRGRPARFYSYDFPAEAPVQPPVLQQINNNLSTIRVQVQNQKNNGNLLITGVESWLRSRRGQPSHHMCWLHAHS